MIDEDIAATVRKLGAAEWGQTKPKGALGHAFDMFKAVYRTAFYFGTGGKRHMNLVTVAGSGVTICLVGTSPNSATIARALTGAWNRLHDECVEQEKTIAP